jgi:PAS domain-containing protein
MIMDIFTLTAKKSGWSKELFYQLVESVKDYAIFVSDLDGTIISWNIGAEKIFGYAPQEAIGQNCRMLFTKEDQVNHVPEKERPPVEKDVPKTNDGIFVKTGRISLPAACKLRFMMKAATTPDTLKSPEI